MGANWIVSETAVVSAQNPLQVTQYETCCEWSHSVITIRPIILTPFNQNNYRLLYQILFSFRIIFLELNSRKLSFLHKFDSLKSLKSNSNWKKVRMFLFRKWLRKTYKIYSNYVKLLTNNIWNVFKKIETLICFDLSFNRINI